MALGITPARGPWELSETVRPEPRKKIRVRSEAYKLAKSDSARIRMMNKRVSALMFLGGQCEHCGFNDSRALQFDHVNGDGAKHRRELSGHGTAQTARAVFAEPGMFQVLCANCNWIKRFERAEHTAPRIQNRG